MHEFTYGIVIRLFIVKSGIILDMSMTCYNSNVIIELHKYD
jgi:hypothetical protein